VIEIDEGITGPEERLQFSPGDDLSPAFEQGLQDLARLILQAQLSSVFEELLPPEIQLEYAEPVAPNSHAKSS
jgi:hypothetical protein